MSNPTNGLAPRSRVIELSIGGMTCASCAMRVEKKLNRLDGVTATVNYATERAQVTFPEAVTPEILIAAVEGTGYTASLPSPPALPGAEGAAILDPGDARTAGLRQRLVICLALTLPVLVLSMVPPAQFRNWQWLALTLASPVVVWGAWPSTRRPGSTPDTARQRWTP